MRFLTKYELLQPVTSGVVESFVARNVASDERVLIHTFDGLEAFASQSPIEWAMKSYRCLAPPLLGELIEAGRYPQTAQAYLICRLPPDPAALQEWIWRYRVHCGETRDSSHLNAESSAAPLFGSADTAPLGELTKAFLGSSTADVDTEGRVISPDTADPAARGRSDRPSWSLHPAGAFSKEFLSGFDEGAQPPPPAAKTVEPPKESSLPGAFTAQFLAATGNKPVAASDPNPPAPQLTVAASSLKSDQQPEGAPQSPVSQLMSNPIDEPENSVPLAKTGTGEFSKFFRGPFGSPSPPAASAPEPVVPLPRREEKGEFTQLFGSGKQQVRFEDSAVNPLVEPPQPREAGSFTELFRTQEPAAPKPEPAAGPVFPAESASVSQVEEIPWRLSSATPSVPPPAVFSPAPREASDLPKPAALPDIEPTFAGRPPRDAGATQAFVPAGGRPAPEPPLPAGPSEYSQVIAAKPEPAAIKPVSSASPAAGGQAASAPQFSAPLPPLQMPVMTPPSPQMHSAPMPQMQAPPMPQMQAPHIPQMPAPAMPPAPTPPAQLGPAGAPRVSYLPLIIAMNVLLLAAVALVLYFALHR